MTRYLETVDQPWSYMEIEKAIFYSFTDARSVIEETAGGKLWRSFQELEDSVWVLDDLPPSRHTIMKLVKSVYREENGREEAFYRRTDHRFFEAGRGRGSGDGALSAAWFQ